MDHLVRTYHAECSLHRIGVSVPVPVPTGTYNPTGGMCRCTFTLPSLLAALPPGQNTVVFTSLLLVPLSNPVPRRPDNHGLQSDLAVDGRLLTRCGAEYIAMSAFRHGLLRGYAKRRFPDHSFHTTVSTPSRFSHVAPPCHPTCRPCPARTECYAVLYWAPSSVFLPSPLALVPFSVHGLLFTFLTWWRSCPF